MIIAVFMERANTVGYDELMHTDDILQARKMEAKHLHSFVSNEFPQGPCMGTG